MGHYVDFTHKDEFPHHGVHKNICNHALVVKAEMTTQPCESWFVCTAKGTHKHSLTPLSRKYTDTKTEAVIQSGVFLADDS